MHGRVKVKTTEQQDREKKIERDAKLKAYRKAMGMLFSRRTEGIKDEQQLLVSGQVLQSNPDIGTLWNIRKEVLLHFFDLEKEETPSGGEENEIPLIPKDARLKKELDLTHQCLMTNPKSYGAWHHRTWTLDHMDNPDWRHELGLCQKYLQYDERNFHCWDYRKWVAKKAEVSPQSELDFTMEKIEENFSNYSAWHYRSKLLPLVFPGEDTASIQEDRLHSELDLVQNAAFTDPEDSSAWFYHTWLLGRQAEVPRIVCCRISESNLTVACTTKIKSAALETSMENGDKLELAWEGTEKTFNYTWTAKINAQSSSCLDIKLKNSEETLNIKLNASDSSLVHGSGSKTTERRFRNLPNQKTKTVLQQALSNCQELLELEPDSKWTLYTKLLIQLNLDSRANHQEVVEGLTRLASIDPSRRNFYTDTATRLRTEYSVESNERVDPDSRYHRQYNILTEA